MAQIHISGYSSNRLSRSIHGRSMESSRRLRSRGLRREKLIEYELDKVSSNNKYNIITNDCDTTISYGFLLKTYNKLNTTVI